uniref:Uncharacterized protein n=1 Tax=Gasterosteus aculeatus aculeatus TaxID=481459 RepID=A0AAQ4S6T3_GASAC
MSHSVQRLWTNLHVICDSSPPAKGWCEGVDSAMNQAEDPEEGVPPSEAPLCGEHDSQTKAQRIHQRPGPGPGPSCVSMKSNRSMDPPLVFKDVGPSVDAREDQESSEVPTGPSAQQHQTHLDSIFMLLEENILTFVKNELKKIQKVVSSDYPECLEKEDEEELDEGQRRSREAFVKISVHFLRRMKQEELAERLQSSKRISLQTCHADKTSCSSLSA